MVQMERVRRGWLPALLIMAAASLLTPTAKAATFTVTRTRGNGNGTLRRAIQAANGAPGSTIAFAIPVNDPGYDPATGVFTIDIRSGLPAISAAGTILDGSTQSAVTGNTNTAILGAGGAVGVDGLPLPRLDGPEIEITSTRNRPIGLDLGAPGIIIRGIAIHGFGSASNNDGHADIRLGSGATGALMEGNVIGTTASSFTDPGATARSVGDNVRSAGADRGVLRNNLIGFSNGKGVGLNGGSEGWLIEGNEIRGSGIGTPNLDAIDIENGSGGAVVLGNLLIQSHALGVDSFQSRGGNRIENNTISGNGVGSGAGLETHAVRLYGSGSTVDRNIITGNTGAGVAVTAASRGNLITRNSMAGNGPFTGQVGIDLMTTSDNQSQGSPPYVSTNDAGDGDMGGNDLVNFPVFTGALTDGTNLSLAGFARPGSAMELFVAAPDPTGFGEGVAYLLTLVEGSPADADGTTGSYASPVGGLNVGSDTTSRFRFQIPLPAGTGVGTVITATATLGGQTSEFSGNVMVQTSAAVTLLKSVSPGGDQPPGADLVYTVQFINGGGSPAGSVVITDFISPLTDFKIGSAMVMPGSTGLTAVVEYSDDGGASWIYLPVSEAGGAPPGHDRLATHLRWVFTGTLPAGSPANQGSVSFGVRIP